MDELLAHQMFKRYSFADVERVVNTNDKKRFLLTQSESGSWFIKANQGHSLAIENKDLKPLLAVEEFPAQVIHGTNKQAYDLIQKSGLSRMNRTHIHMAKGLPGDSNVISGMRKSSTVFIIINVEKALSEGITFFESTNGVILSPGNESGVIPPTCFKEVQIREKK